MNAGFGPAAKLNVVCSDPFPFPSSIEIVPLLASFNDRHVRVAIAIEVAQRDKARGWSSSTGEGTPEGSVVTEQYGNIVPKANWPWSNPVSHLG
jgi:hypothetical protein